MIYSALAVQHFAGKCWRFVGNNERLHSEKPVASIRHAVGAVPVFCCVVLYTPAPGVEIGPVQDGMITEISMLMLHSWVQNM